MEHRQTAVAVAVAAPGTQASRGADPLSTAPTAMLDDEDAAGRDQGRRSIEDLGWRAGRVGRVEEDDCEQLAGGRQPIQGPDRLALDHTHAAGQAGVTHVRGDHPRGPCIALDEDHPAGATAQGLDADGPGAGKEIEKTGAGHPRPEDVEQRFAHARRGRAHTAQRCRCEPTAATMSSGEPQSNPRVGAGSALPTVDGGASGREGNGLYTAAQPLTLLDFPRSGRYDSAAAAAQYLLKPAPPHPTGIIWRSMKTSFRRALPVAIAIVSALPGPWVGPGGLEAAVFAPRPGPIDRPLSVAIADFDRDGRDDIVVADYQAGILQILLGQADGTFAAIDFGPFGVGSATFSAATSGPFEMAVTDLEPDDVDGDAVPNVRDDCPNVYNPADTTGRQFDSETAAGPDGTCDTADDNPALYGPDGLCGGTNPDDLTGDGIGEACEILSSGLPIDPDLDGVPTYDPGALALDNCPGLPTPPQPYRPPCLRFVVHPLDNCPSLPNPGQEDTETAPGPDTICGTADDNPGQYGADGLCDTADDLVGDHVGDACAFSPDLLILGVSQASGSSLGVLRVRLNDGEGGLVGRPSYLTGVGPGSISVADFNNDRRPDVAITNTTIDLVQILPGAADGQFGGQTFLNTGDGAQGSAAGDLDGDGDVDLAVGDRTANTLSIFLNAAGVMPTTASATVTTKAAPTVLLTGDLDGNAFGDLVVLDQGVVPDDAHIEVFLGAADGAVVGSQDILMGPGQVPRSGLLRDLNGDGTLDLAVADFPGRQVLLYSGAGDGTFAPAGSFPTPPLPPLTGQPTSLAAIDLSIGGPDGPDLAVLQFSNRVDLYVNGGGFAFAASPMTPASAWRDTSAMALFGADTLVSADLVLLQRETASFETMSGLGDSSFRPTQEQVIDGLAPVPGSAADAAAMLVADLRVNGRPDLAVLDPTAGRITVLTNELTGVLQERTTTSVDPGAAGLSSGTLLASTTDIDRDGVLNGVDDCPTVYNPPLCRVSDPACLIEVPCTDAALTPTSCDPGVPATLDPLTGQCDSDQNGIGDHCQILSENCAAQDSDFDLVSDYDPNALARTLLGALDFDRDTFPNTLDNCPTIANTDQADTNGLDDGAGAGDACEILSNGQPVDPDLDGVPTYDPTTLVLDNCPALDNPSQQDNDGDGVGNTCVLDAALDNCPVTINLSQADADGDDVGDACSFPPLDVLVPNPVTGEMVLLGGDGTGALHPAAASPLSGLAGPVAAVTGHFALECAIATICFGRSDFDIAVAARGVSGSSADDQVVVYLGDGVGGFSALPAEPAAGDPASLIVASNQPICPLPGDLANPSLRFDPDAKSDILTVLEPGSAEIQILLVSNQNALNPSQSPLVPPVARPTPLPVPVPLRAAVAIDANRDGVSDLVALSSPPGGPSILTLFMGLGNGLYYTDPTLNPAPVPAELDFPAGGFINIKTDNVYPDLALFSVTDQVPITLFNVIGERADIDGSGRIDGYDLMLLALAFGSVRGEDFTLLPDATLQQTGTGPTRRLVGTGAAKPGQDLPDSAGFCSTGFLPLTGLYGLPVDINLDGIVDGEDLALLAASFGGSVTP